MKDSTRILHISTDEKFVNATAWLFEYTFPDSNHFLILRDHNKLELKYVNDKILNLNHVHIKEAKTYEYLIKEFDVVVLHGLNIFTCRMVLKYHSTTKFVWCFWGAEIYDNPKGLYHITLGEKTKRATRVLRAKSKFKHFIKDVYHKLFFSVSENQLKIDAIKKIKNVAILHKEDFDLLNRNGFLSTNARHVIYSYYPLEYIFDESEKMIVNEANILVGNSASYTNNYHEVFGILKSKEQDIEKRKIYVPLSYGNFKYANIVIKEGIRIFNDSFIPITNFMQLNEYNSLLKKCGIVIMNHYRQQAVGNIVAMVWMGAKVFLDEQNTFYHYLKRIGIHVYSISEDLVNKSENVFDMLTIQQVEHNRKVIKAQLSKDYLASSLTDSIQSILDES